MLRNESKTRRLVLLSATLSLVGLVAGCSRKPGPAALNRIATGSDYAGFLSSYENLKPNPGFENTLTFVKQDDSKNLHKYFAVIVDPVQLYVATNADVSKIPDRGRVALAAYFHHALTRAVSDAFPVVQEPGPLVLRLRTALIGVDSAAESTPGEKIPGALEHAMDISKVGVEGEMVDSVTGEQIAAAVDRQRLGSAAVIGSEDFSREERFAAAREALDGWAARLREVLDSAHELSGEDASRADASYRPYSEPFTPRKK